MENQPVMIEGQNLTVSLGALKDDHILRGVDFSAEAGQVAGICGPNGAGKSTLLRTLAGFLTPQGGEVRLQGRPLARIPMRERARLFAYMHQETSMSFAFTAEEVVGMGRTPHQARFAAPGEKDRVAVTRAMAQAGCEALAKQPFAQLSGGERQRVQLARALCQETPILLLDEPAASLDLHFAGQLYALAKTHAEAGGTTVLVMHDLRAAALACDWLYLLHQGQMVAQGPPRQVLTGENLRAAYGAQAVIFDNPAGEWDYYIAR